MGRQSSGKQTKTVWFGFWQHFGRM